MHCGSTQATVLVSLYAWQKVTMASSFTKISINSFIMGVSIWAFIAITAVLFLFVLFVPLYIQNTQAARCDELKALNKLQLVRVTVKHVPGEMKLLIRYHSLEGHK